jgi:hypothetical protein
MEAYAHGRGHEDLAQRLGISQAESLAIGGSANSRIIRTTLKHSYQQTQPTFYVVGLTFLSRLELPILESQPEFEGRWTNPQNQKFTRYWQYGWTQQETDQFIDTKLKSEIHSILDRTEDLMYRILSLIASLSQRGHQVLVYQQADNLYQQFLDDPRLCLFKDADNIIDGYAWRAVSWQLQQGVPPQPSTHSQHHVPDDMQHPATGYHAQLNKFLVDYVSRRNMLL